MAEKYNLPTYKSTTSVKRYLAAWHKLAAPFEKALNMQLYSYDPGITLVRGDRSVDFDHWVTLSLYKAITGEDFTE